MNKIDFLQPTGTKSLLLLPHIVSRNSPGRKIAIEPVRPPHGDRRLDGQATAGAGFEDRVCLHSIKSCWSTVRSDDLARLDFGDTISRHMEMGRLGALDSLMQCSESVDELLLVAEKYYSLLSTGGTFRVDEYYGHRRVVHEGHHQSWLMAEFAFVLLVDRVRTVSGERIVPRKFTLGHERSGLRNLATWLGCPVSHGPRYEILFERTEVEHRFALAKPERASQYRSATDLALRRLWNPPAVDPAHTLAPQLSRLLTWAIPEFPADLDWTAEYLSMSSRTLQRRLAREETSFRVILEEVRITLCANLLRLNGVARQSLWKRLGFSSVQSYRRARSSWGV